MLNLKTYVDGIAKIAGAGSFAPAKSQVEAIFEILKNDFSDEDFQFACEQIVKNEALYDKIPCPAVFYGYIKKLEKDRALAEALKWIDESREREKLNKKQFFN